MKQPRDGSKAYPSRNLRSRPPPSMACLSRSVDRFRSGRSTLPMPASTTGRCWKADSLNTHPGLYTAIGADGYELCEPIDPADFERINAEINGVSRRSTWQPIPVAIIREDNGKVLATSDSPWLGAHALIFRSESI